jgi:hypothetical protein
LSNRKIFGTLLGARKNSAAAFPLALAGMKAEKKEGKYRKKT